MHLIGFAGYAKAGKTTAAKFTLEYAHMERLRGRKIAFADPLKELCGKMFPWLPSAVWTGTQEQKEALLGPDDGCEGWSGRRILQHIGTEGFRAVDPSLWVKHFTRSVLELEKDRYYDVIVADDVRFPEEVEAIQALGGKVYRILREGTTQSTHASELGINDLAVDGEIPNYGTLREFNARVLECVSFAPTTPMNLPTSTLR